VSLRIGEGVSAAFQTSTLQVWEKPVAPGLTYREEVDLDAPRMIHILRFNPGAATTVAAELAGGTIYGADANKGRATVSDLVKRKSAIAAINGDYFPFTGDPLGLMIHEGKLFSLPYQVHSNPLVTRPAFFWKGSQTGFAGKFTFSGTASIGEGAPIQIDGFNQECGANQIALETPVAALAQAKAPNLHVVVKLTRFTGGPNGEGEGEVRGMFSDQTNVPVPEGNIVLVANGNRVAALATARPGSHVRFRWSVGNFPFTPDEAIGGGPFLVREGKVAVDAKEEGFDQTFTEKHHPRTAIGRRANGELWFVVVDGRQKMSDGMSLPQLGQWFLDHGCTDAMNLDGGGSSAINIFGQLVNRPSDAAERPVANAVVFYGPTAAPVQDLKIVNPDPNVLRITTAAGELIPNVEVIWGCQGAAWIDQGGNLHPVATGDAKITAWCRGTLLQRSLPMKGA